MFNCFHRRAGLRAARSLQVGAALLFLTASPQALAQALGLHQILERAAQADPGMAVVAAQVEAAEAGVRQAGVRPNDVIALDAENFVGTGPYGPANMSESTVWYERTWERASKRDARIGAARSDLGVVAQRGRLRALDFLEKVEEAWVEAVAAEAAIAVAEEHLRVTRAVEREVARRVGAALDPLFAAQRARTDLAQAEIALDQAVQTARMTRERLARYWGGDGDFTLDTAPFDVLGTPVTAKEDSPDLALLMAERDAAEARARLEDTKGVADPTLKAGVRHLAQTNDVALVLGAAIPLGTRRANRANVERARAEQDAAEAELAVSRIEREREIAGLVATRRAIASEMARIDREVLPSARRSVSLVQDGLRRGGLAFTYLEAANARAVVVQSRTRRIDLLRRYHLAGARLDRLTGRHLDLLSRAENRR
jgi:cobalt-zinc-cadmium efflux system outer membrane protein